MAFAARKEPGIAAMLSVKSGAMTYIRAATNVQKPDDSGRAIGTTLAGDPLESINAGKAFLRRGASSRHALRRPLRAIKDASGATIGAYFVGYKK